MLKNQWRKFAESYDAPTGAAQSSPGIIVIGVGGMILILLIIGYFPALAELSQFRMAWLPTACMATGAVFSYTAHKRGATGTIGTACMLIDTTLYTTAMALAVVLTESPFSVGFAIIMTFFFLALPGSFYSLTWLIALAMCGPPISLVLLVGTDPLANVVVWAGCTIALTASLRTGQQRALRSQNERLQNALGAADRVAEQSMEAALAAALLDVGHFLHELRNTRSVQQTNLQYVLEEGGVQGEALEALKEAIQAQLEENRLVSEAIERLRSKAQTTQQNFVLHDVLQEFVKDRPGNFPVELVLQAPAFLVRGDTQHINVILSNLVRNAEQVGAKHVKIELSANPDSKSVLLSVQDDGPGVQQDILSDLFRPFGEGRRDGTGLGLYLTRRYVSLLGGNIEVANRPEGGAVFRVMIPGRLADDPNL